MRDGHMWMVSKAGGGVSRESLWKMITCGLSVTLKKGDRGTIIES